MAEDELTQKAREAVSERLSGLYGRARAQAAFKAATGFDFWASAVQSGLTRDAIVAAVEAYIADNPPTQAPKGEPKSPPSQPPRRGNERAPLGDVANVQGNPYLRAGARARKFREAHPTGCIRTELVAVSDDSALFKAEVITGDGQLLAVAHARATVASSSQAGGRFCEKAETSAIARALGLAGFGNPEDES